MENIIDVKDACLILEKNEILKNINLAVKEKSICGLIGRNGSGKTMLIKCISGFVRPTSGKIYVNGEQIGVDADFPTGMGFIIETPGFIPYYSGFTNLVLLASIRGKIDKDDIAEIMHTVGLDPKLKRHVGKYSLGMRQRLGIAQALMENPELLILDEPFNGLDKEGVEDMRRLMLELRNNGKTILLVSHSAEDIDILCDCVYEMEHGELTRIR